MQSEPAPGYRGRYEVPTFDEIPPGVEPPVPGFEPSPFEKPPLGPPGSIDRDRSASSNYRDPYRPPPYGEVGPGYRDVPLATTLQSEIPVHVGEQTRFRDNYRPNHYRDQGPVPFRDVPYRDGPQGGLYREPNYRGGARQFRDSAYRNVPYRDGAFRDTPSHNRFSEPGVPFRPPSADPRESVPPPYHDPNFRDAYREEGSAPRDHTRPGYRSSIRNSNRGGPRRNQNLEHERHRDRDPKDREKYKNEVSENREIVEKSERNRDLDRRSGYDKPREVRESRDDRVRDYDRNRDYEKDREHERASPDKKLRNSPKRNRETREKKRSESRGRSRDRESRREKKEEKIREKSSDRRDSRDHKDKEKKLKDRKKKKREKEKDADKKKKRDKKDKKEKEHSKKDDDTDKGDKRNDEVGQDAGQDEKLVVIKTEKNNGDGLVIKKETESPKNNNSGKHNDLYGDDAVGAVDKEIIENYVKTEEKSTVVPTDTKNTEVSSKEEPFDGIELQATADELDLKAEMEVNSQPTKEMLATLPELSKWEVEEENVEKTREPGEITSPDEEEDGSKVTSDVIKRAENAIFAKAISSLRPIEIKKISSDRLKLYGDEASKTSMNNIQITVPVVDSEHRSIEINETKRRYSKTPPPRLSVKERLGGKVEDLRKGREQRVVQSTVERVKSRSKTPKRDQRDQSYRRVTVERERGRKLDANNRTEPSKSDRRIVSEAIRSEKHRGRSPSDKKNFEKNLKDDKKSNESTVVRDRGQERNTSNVKVVNVDRERKKSTLDEAHFEPDYDETVESDTENKDDIIRKRERSLSPDNNVIEAKKVKVDSETIKLDLANVKKKPESDSESSSDSEYSSSSSSSDARKRKKKKKRSKKKKKRAGSDSESDSESSSDDHKKKKKKRKHKKKSSKKKKKSKHK